MKLVDHYSITYSAPNKTTKLYVCGPANCVTFLCWPLISPQSISFNVNLFLPLYSCESSWCEYWLGTILIVIFHLKSWFFSCASLVSIVQRWLVSWPFNFPHIVPCCFLWCMVLPGNLTDELITLHCASYVLFPRQTLTPGGELFPCIIVSFLVPDICILP